MEYHGHGDRNSFGIKCSRTYTSWRAMKKRCLNPSNIGYSYYGGRGITVCDRWLHSFKNFLADMGVRPEGKNLDRIDSNGNYEPGNCRWATATEQIRNRNWRQRWSRAHDACLRCGDSTRRHEAHGLCSLCWQRERRAS